MSKELYSDAFRNYLKHGVQGLDGREKRALDTTNDAALVSESFQDILINEIEGSSALRRCATVIKTDRPTTIPYNATALYPAATPTAEAGALQDRSPDFSSYKANGFKYSTSVTVSNELVQDAKNIEEYLAAAIGRGMAFREETMFWTGSGSGEPTGIINTTGINITDVSGAEKITEIFTALISGNKTDASIGGIYRLSPLDRAPFRKWIGFANPYALQRSLIDDGGTGDDLHKIIDQSNDPSKYDFFLGGVPFSLTNGLERPNAADKVFGAIGDPTTAVIVDIGQPILRRDTESLGATNQTIFSVLHRVDFVLTDPDSISCIKRTA